jgi:gmma-aminobutyric acid receptor subunit gamma
VVKQVQQCLFKLGRLKKFGLAPINLTNYRYSLTGCSQWCITAWYGNYTAHNRRAFQRVVRSTQRIIGGTLPALQDIYSTQCHRKAKKIIKDLSHLSHGLSTLLPSRRKRQYRCNKAWTDRLINSFYLQAIRLLNSHH